LQLFSVSSQNFKKFQKSDLIKYEADPKVLHLLRISELATGRSYWGGVTKRMTGLQPYKKTQTTLLAFSKQTFPSE